MAALVGGAFQRAGELLEGAGLLFLHLHAGFERVALTVLRSDELPHHVAVPCRLRLRDRATQVGEDSAHDGRCEQEEHGARHHPVQNVPARGFIHVPRQSAMPLRPKKCSRGGDS